jgi:hypothetical protein
VLLEGQPKAKCNFARTAAAAAGSARRMPNVHGTARTRAAAVRLVSRARSAMSRRAAPRPKGRKVSGSTWTTRAGATDGSRARPVTLILYVNAKLVLPSPARALSLRQSRGDSGFGPRHSRSGVVVESRRPRLVSRRGTVPFDALQGAG